MTSWVPFFFLQILFCLVRWRTSKNRQFFRSLLRSLTRFRTRVWLGHSRTYMASLVLSCLCAQGCCPKGAEPLRYYWSDLCILSFLSTSFYSVSKSLLLINTLMLPPPCSIIGMVWCNWWAVIWESESPVGGFWQIPGGLLCVSDWVEALIWTLCLEAQISGVLQWWLIFCKFLPSPHIISGAQPEWTSSY